MSVEEAPEAKRARWFAKGSSESNGGMLEQGDYSIKTGNAHKAKLAERGFGEQKLVLMSELYDELRGLLAGRGELKTDKLQATRNVSAAIDSAKEHTALLGAALPPLLRDRELTSPTSVEVLPRAIKRSTQKIISYLTEIRGVVENLNEELRPSFNGGSALEAHDKVLNDLINASTTQSTKKKELPYETRLIHETKGALLELIEDMNRMGRFVYRGQAELAAKFNKDILLKSRRRAARQAAADADATLVEEGEGEEKK